MANSMNGEKAENQIEISDPDTTTETAGGVLTEENFETTKKLFVEGKRNLVLGNYAEAVDCLDECCRLYVKHFGEMSTECVDPYFYYGKSLLELERTKDQKVLEQKEEGSEESGIDDGGEEEQNESEENKNAVDENDIPVEDPIQNNGSTNGDQQKADVAQQEGPEAVNENNGNGIVDTSELSAAGDAVEDVDGEEPKEKQNDGLVVAWEMIDLARVILEKEPKNDENCLRLANCRMVLGEINFANEEFQGAVDEFHACLDIYHAILPADDRRLSETYFQIGSSFDLDNQFGAAADSFKKAVSILELRKSNLEKKLNDETKSDTDREEAKKEIDDLSTLIVDMIQRMNDTLECERHKKEAKLALDECTGKVNTEVNGDDTNSHDATDVSHLVRKQPVKRPVEETIGDAEAMKRTRLGNGECVLATVCESTTGNGHCAVNGNGEACPTTNNGAEISAEQTVSTNADGQVVIQEMITIE